MRRLLMPLATLLCSPAFATELSFPDLPQPPQLEAALDSHISVQAAMTSIKVEQANQRKWDSGAYEFNLRAGASQRNVTAGGQRLKEWDVALERPLRLPEKAQIDAGIGAQGVLRAEYALGDAHHEAGRTLLRLWFNWLRERAQADQWQQQMEILQQQAQITEKRVKAGDAPRMELNQANAAAAQAGVSLQQARVRTQVAAGELTREFPGLALPEKVEATTPRLPDHDLNYWKERMLDDNHELGVAHAEARIRRLLAQRGRADRTPDPTVGVRYASESGGNERVTGLYLSVPLPTGVRAASAESAAYEAEIYAARELFVKHRLENDISTTYSQAIGGYDTWLQANEAAINMRRNADLAARAYGLGESSLSDVLTARRLALESSLAANIAQLDANEARYWLLLDTHQMWTDHDRSAPHEH